MIWILIAIYLFSSLIIKLFIEKPSYKVGFCVMFSLWGLLMIYSSVYTILSRAVIEVNGTIIEARKEPYFPDDPRWAHLRNTRYACIYTIESSSGDDNIQYIAHQNDKTLAQDLPIGMKIEKKKWEITYKLNNEIIEDFPTQNYINVGCLGVLFVIINLIRICYYYWFR